MNEKLADALNNISDAHILDAATAKPSRKRTYLRIAAAVLVLVLILQLPNLPMVVTADTVAEASPSRLMQRPDSDDYQNTDDFSKDYDLWREERQSLASCAKDTVSGATEFFRQSSALYLAEETENRVWSPVNAYITLAMLAEITDGNSRAQILHALGVSDLDTLRTQVDALWESAYQEGNEACELANSLWLSDELGYVQETMDNLSYYHHASVYQADLSGRKASRALQAWLNNNTGGLLKESAETATFPENAVLTLASTVYLQAKWSSVFSASRNTQGAFHSPSGDVDVTYMNKPEFQTNYYWAECFGAVKLSLKNGCYMWFLLPDEGYSPQDIAQSEEFWNLLQSGYDAENCKYMKVNLSVPKFDIASGGDCGYILKEMGITDVFDLQASDFSAITGDTPVAVTGMNQAARVIIDEEGVKAASYIELPTAGSAAPPEEIIDFILDRPFLFAITDSNGVPLFLGTVNQP